MQTKPSFAANLQGFIYTFCAVDGTNTEQNCQKFILICKCFASVLYVTRNRDTERRRVSKYMYIFIERECKIDGKKMFIMLCNANIVLPCVGPTFAGLICVIILLSLSRHVTVFRCLFYAERNLNVIFSVLE